MAEVGLGMEVGHYVEGDPHALRFARPFEAAKFEVLADTPVGHCFWQLYDAKQLPVVLSLREPHKWVSSRVGHKADRVEGGCIGAPYVGLPAWGRRRQRQGARDDDDAPAARRAIAAFLAYQAWVACVVPADKLHLVHLFEKDREATNRRALDDLARASFLHGQRALEAAPDPAKMAEALRVCDDGGDSWRRKPRRLPT